MSYPSCPRCGVEVGSTWRWCLACGYDPDGAAQQVRARAIEARRRKANLIPTVVVCTGLALGGAFLWKTTPSNGSSRVPPTVASTAAVQWRAFTPADGGFVVDMPGTPAESQGRFGPTGGSSRSFVATSGERIVSVLILDTERPELDEGVSSDVAAEVLRRTVDHIAGATQGTVGETTETFVGPADALDFTIEGTASGRTRGRIVLGGRLLYVVSVTAPEADPAVEDRVIGSFRFA